MFIFIAASVSFADDDLCLVGAGALVSSTPYAGAKTLATAVPFASWQYKSFYIKGVEAGYRFYRTDALALSVLVAPRFMGYHSSDSDALDGMDDRRMSLDAGLKARVSLPWEGAGLTARVTNDALSRSHGHVAQLGIDREFKAEIWRFTPSAGVRVQSGRMTDYYYGVRSEEARTDRPEYRPGAAVNYFADAMFSFGISKNWIVVTKGDVEFLADEVRKSPIVNKSVLFSGFVGLAWRF
jgi:outer membrane protein